MGNKDFFKKSLLWFKELKYPRLRTQISLHDPLWATHELG